MRRHRWQGWMVLAVTFAFLYSTVADARRRRRRRRHRSKSAYVIPKGSATHALKPLEAIGLGRKRVKRITARLQSALARVPGVKLAPLKKIHKFLKSHAGATYAACEGELSCVVKFGKLIKAPLVVAGDLSGLGKGYVLFLRLVEPGSGKVVRKVSVVFAGKRGREPTLLREAAFRLLAPEKFRGRLKLTVDVEGAAVFLNGKPLGKSPIKEREVEAGTHALRITHPEYHDYLRFVSVAFEKTTTIQVSLKQFPIISEEMKSKARRKHAEPLAPGQRVIYRPIPWYKRWWFVTSVGAAVVAAVFTTVALSRRRHLDRDGSVTLTQQVRAPALPVFRFGR